MKITKKKPVKDVIKAKAKAIKQKVKGKVKGCAALVALFGVAAICGCMTPEQASRSTHATYGDMEAEIETDIGEKAHNNTVSVTVRVNIGDGAIASADSSGSTESQTQTPTFDIRPQTDLRYNDALSAASGTSKNILESLGSVLTDTGKAKLLSMIESKATGTVTLDKKDGTQAVVECKDGQCTSCTDCGDPK